MQTFFFYFYFWGGGGGGGVDNYLHAAFREVVIDTLEVTIPCMVKKSVTRSAINIVYGDLGYGKNHMKTLNVSENNNVSELPPLTAML